MDKPTYEELVKQNEILLSRIEFNVVEKHMVLKQIELTLINLLFCAIKNPYNGLLDSTEFNIALENIISICVHNNIKLGMEYDPTNVFVHDATEIFEDISNRIQNKLLTK